MECMEEVAPRADTTFPLFSPHKWFRTNRDVPQILMSATTSAPAAMNAGGVQLREIGTPETRYDVDPLVGKILWDLERTANTSQLEDFGAWRATQASRN